MSYYIGKPVIRSGGDGGLILREPPNIFTGSNRNGARSARDTYFNNAANASILTEYQSRQHLAIVLEWGNNTVWQVYEPGNVGSAYNANDWIDAPVAAEGIQGQKGDKGDKGDTGDRGERGLQGIQGLKGDKGDTGDTGNDGTDGTDGTNGRNAPIPLYRRLSSAETPTGGNLTADKVFTPPIGWSLNPATAIGTGKIYVSNADINSASVSYTQAVQWEGTDGERGQTGERGERGERGLTGEKGDKGDTGDAGTNGTDGTDGTDGSDGAQGRFEIKAYRNDTTTPSTPTGGSYNVGTGVFTPPTGWTISVTDKTTAQSTYAVEAPINPLIHSTVIIPVWSAPYELSSEAGPRGEKGDKGDTGDRGERGERGLQGIQGLKGDKGDTGDAGTDGINGRNAPIFIYQRASVSSTPTGGSLSNNILTPPRGWYVSPSLIPAGTELIYASQVDISGASPVYTTSEQWQGSVGPTGSRGEKGDTGDRGSQGLKGDKGDTGDRGSQGERGLQGIQGIQGFQGRYFIRIFQTAASQPATPSGGQYNIDTGVLSSPAGWATSPTDPPTGQNIYYSDAEIDPARHTGVFTPTWSVAIEASSERGPKGDKGDKGDTGDRGPAGHDGADGQGVPDATGVARGAVLTTDGNGNYYLNIRQNAVFIQSVNPGQTGFAIDNPNNFDIVYNSTTGQMWSWNGVEWSENMDFLLDSEIALNRSGPSVSTAGPLENIFLKGTGYYIPTSYKTFIRYMESHTRPEKPTVSYSLGRITGITTGWVESDSDDPAMNVWQCVINVPQTGAANVEAEDMSVPLRVYWHPETPTHTGMLYLFTRTTTTTPTTIPSSADSIDIADGLSVTVPTFTENAYIIFAQPAVTPDITQVIRNGRNRISAFLKQTDTFTYNGVEYEWWRTEFLQKPLNSGAVYEVRRD